MGFASLQHMQEFEVHLTRAWKPPAKFRLQGLITLLTAFSLEPRAGLVSYRQRSWDSPLRRFVPPGRFHRVSAGKNLHTVSPAISSDIRRHQTGWRSLSFQVHASRKCPAAARDFKPTTASAFLGVDPSRVDQRQPWPGFRPASSHTLHGFWRLLAESVGVSESQSTADSLRPTPAEAATGQSHPYGVLAPACS